MTRAAVATLTVAALLLPVTRAEALDAAFKDWQQAHRRPKICARFRPGPAEMQRGFPSSYRKRAVKREACLKAWHRKQRREFRAEQARLRVNTVPVEPQPFAGGYTGMGSGCASGYVHDLIMAQPWDDAYALSIASRESGCNPNAYNPTEWGGAGCHASGVFQILDPCNWPRWSESCGYAGASVFDAATNVAVAACIVGPNGNWGPWAA